MPSASSCRAARTTSSTLRLWPRCTTSTPWDWISRRMMLIAASWPSNRLAAVTKRSGARSVWASGSWLAGVLMGARAPEYCESPDCNAPARSVRQFAQGLPERRQRGFVAAPLAQETGVHRLAQLYGAGGGDGAFALLDGGQARGPGQAQERQHAARLPFRIGHQGLVLHVQHPLREGLAPVRHQPVVAAEVPGHLHLVVAVRVGVGEQFLQVGE